MSSVWVGMATLRDRPEGRAATLESLLPQGVFFTLYDGTGIGDQVKFWGARHAPEFFFTIDDDLICPPDYVERMLDGLQRYPNSIVSFHGWRMNNKGKQTDNYRVLETCERDQEVHVLGTGCMGFHVDTIRPLVSDFPTPNNADLHLAIRAEREGIKRVVLQHEPDWIGYTEPPSTIWYQTSRRTGGPLDQSAVRPKLLTELAGLIYGKGA